MSEAELIDRVDALIARLREPTHDLVGRMLELEPAVAALSQAWAEAGVTSPSGTLRGRAASLRAEVAIARTKLTIRGRAIARVKRAVDEARGATYDKGARVQAGGGRLKTSL